MVDFTIVVVFVVVSAFVNYYLSIQQKLTNLLLVHVTNILLPQPHTWASHRWMIMTVLILFTSLSFDSFRVNLILSMHSLVGLILISVQE